MSSEVTLPAASDAPRVYIPTRAHRSLAQAQASTRNPAEREAISRRMSVVGLAEVLADVMQGRSQLWEHSTALVDYLAEIDTNKDIPPATFKQIHISGAPS